MNRSRYRSIGSRDFSNQVISKDGDDKQVAKKKKDFTYKKLFGRLVPNQNFVEQYSYP